MKGLSTRVRAVLLAVAIVALSIGLGEADNGFNIDLGTYLGSPAATFGGASGQTGTWISPELGITPNIIDTTGAATTVTIDVSGMTVGGWGPSTCSGEVDKLIRDHLFRCYGSWSVEFSGLPNGFYVVYIYATNVEIRPLGNLIVNGVAHGQLPGTTSCDLVAGETYLAPAVEVSAQTLTVVGEYGSTGTDCLGVGGLQLVPALFADGFESGTTSAWSSTTGSP